MRYFVTIAGRPLELVLDAERDGGVRARAIAPDGAAAEHVVELAPIEGRTRFALRIDGATHDVAYDEGTGRVTVDGVVHAVAIEDERERAAHRAVADRPKGPHVVASSMPGIVRAILVQPGQAVVAGQPLVILEAMKMENELRAEHAGVVRDIQVAAGTAVDGGAQLLVLDPPAGG